MLFSCYKLALFSQSLKNRHIEINAFASITGTKFNIQLLPKQDSLEIVFKIRDSTATLLLKDTAYNSCRNKLLSYTYFDLKNDTIKAQLCQLMDIAEKFTYYRKDSVRIANSDNTNFVMLIDQIFNTSTDSLENTEQNKNKITLDGISVSFTFTDGNVVRKVYSSTPQLNSYPLLYKLLTTSSNIYRQKKENNFLDSRSLFGY